MIRRREHRVWTPRCRCTCPPQMRRQRGGLLAVRLSPAVLLRLLRLCRVTDGPRRSPLGHVGAVIGRCNIFLAWLCRIIIPLSVWIWILRGCCSWLTLQVGIGVVCVLICGSCLRSWAGNHRRMVGIRRSRTIRRICGIRGGCAVRLGGGLWRCNCCTHLHMDSGIITECRLARFVQGSLPSKRGARREGGM